MTEETNGPDGAGEPSPPGPNHRDEAASPERVERLARRLDDAGDPYVRVTVVRREPPVSARVGDRAILTPAGDLVGWVGGAECAQSVVMREATRALATGEPVLVGLAPDPDDVDRPGLESFPMTCHSGGTLELFVEPVRPAPRLVVAGDSPAARTLVRLAAALAYDLTAVTGDEIPEADRDGHSFDDAVSVVASTDDAALEDAVAGASAVVVATMGAFDEDVLAAAVRAEAPYVGLVSSHPRADDLFDAVADRTGRSRDAVAAAVTVPAGLDIGAETPEEIAVSVLAELVQREHEPAPSDSAAAARKAEGDGTLTQGTNDHADDQNAGDGTAGETAVDPVCGMTVDVGAAAATVEHAGETYRFCAQGCADAFAADPERFTGQDAEAR